MVYRCELLDRPAQPALVIRARAPVEKLPQVLGPAWGAIIGYAGQLGVWPSGAPFVAYLNMDMADLDLEIGFPFAGSPAGRGEILASEIRGGRAATCLHIGPYDRLTAAYAALGDWMKAEGHTPTGVAYEFYLNDPQTTAPDALQTQIVFPLQ
jgi:effector-binding domain-containing protein